MPRVTKADVEERDAKIEALETENTGLRDDYRAKVWEFDELVKQGNELADSFEGLIDAFDAKEAELLLDHEEATRILDEQILYLVSLFGTITDYQGYDANIPRQLASIAVSEFAPHV